MHVCTFSNMYYLRRPRGESPAPPPFFSYGPLCMTCECGSWSNLADICVKKEASKIRQDGSKIQPKSSKLGPKIHQVGAQNHPKSVPEALLDGSGRHLGPSWLQEPRRTRKSTKNLPNMGPTWKPKSTKNRFKGDLNVISFLMVLGMTF